MESNEQMLKQMKYFSEFRIVLSSDKAAHFSWKIIFSIGASFNIVVSIYLQTIHIKT